MNKQLVRALLLDFDGTIANSIPFLFKLYSDFLAQRGECGSFEEFNLLNGLSMRDVIKYVCIRHGLKLDSAESLGASYMHRMRELYSKHILPFEGVREFLQTVQKMSIQVAIVSSASRELIELFLRQHELATFIGCIVTAEGLPDGKPDPAIYRRGLEAVHVAADEAIAVEDSINGIRASVGADIPTIALIHNGEVPSISVDLLAKVTSWNAVLEVVKGAAALATSSSDR